MPITPTGTNVQTNLIASQDFAINIQEYLTPEARQRLSRSLLRSRINSDIIETNALAGVKAVTKDPIRKRIAETLPGVDLAPVLDIPRLAATYGHACRTASKVIRRDEELQSAISRGFKIHQILTAQVDALVSVDLVSKEEAAALRAGRGVINMANDLRDGAELLAKHWSKIAGKTAITDALLAEAREVGKLLKERVRPDKLNKKRADGNEDPASVEDRHLLFTLLSERYEVVRRIGYWFWGDDFDRYTPALGAGVRKPRQKKADVDAPSITRETEKEPTKPAPMPLSLPGAMTTPPPQPMNEVRG